MDGLQERLTHIDREVYLLEHSEAVLGWDQETNLPPRGVEERAEQLALLQGLIHERVTSPEVAQALTSWEETHPEGQDPSGPEIPGREEPPGTGAAFYRAWRRRHNRAVRLPRELVEKTARTTALAQAQWARARQESDFSLFLPLLDQIIELSREAAERIGYQDHPYDALLDQYEPWMTTAETERIFSRLREELSPFVRSIAEAGKSPPDLPSRSYPEEAQEAFGRRVLEAMGFPPDRGRLDRSTHPFTSSLGADDVRLTTRYDEEDFRSSLFGIIHEAGHGLYELGLGRQVRGTTLGTGTSLGIHESQSRIWENMIGRSLPFWRHWYPILLEYFPGSFDALPLDDFYRMINRVEPSLIRVEADEVTYSLHIILRFLLEKDLISGALQARDLPQAWNSLSRELLGQEPPDHARGVLQDIHWSLGAFGYFPTYALGNLYAAQFFHRLKQEHPDLDKDLSRGDLGPIREWLGTHIHVPGASRTAAELVRDATGSPLDPAFFIRYLRVKYGNIYGL